MIALSMFFIAGALQMDPDLTSAAVNRELEKFQREYLRSNGLEPTEVELGAARARFGLVQPEKRERSAKEREIDDKFTFGLVANFKLQRDVYRKHGGRVVLSAFGFDVAKDAMIAELQEWEKAGRWRFASAKLRKGVFEYLGTMRGDGVVEGERAKEVFAQPIWIAPVK
jgi:hypothetical protein